MAYPHMTVARFYRFVLPLAIGTLIVFFHVWKLQDVPRGLHVDEACFGSESLSIAASGYDLRGAFMPTYFITWWGVATGPVYIYLSALIFKVAGATVFTLRLTSALWYFLFLLGIYQLVNRLMNNDRIAAAYILIAAGFLPWYFTLSRIGFDVIAQLGTVMLALLFIHHTYHNRYTSARWRDAILAGIFVGFSTYTYPSARVLSFLLIASVAVLYRRRAMLKRSILIVAAFLATLVPYGVFFLRNSEAMVLRFKGVTYLLDPTTTVLAKAHMFITNYASHFGTQFLLTDGDSNLRHATGFGGEIFFTVFLLLLAGLAWYASSPRTEAKRYNTLLFVNMLFAPIPSAMTSEGVPHSLRSIVLGIYMLLFSVYGLKHMRSSIRSPQLRTVFVTCVFAALSIEATLYVHDYFVRYPGASSGWFGAQGMQEAFGAAVQEKPRSIIISNDVEEYYYDFYRFATINPQNIPIERGAPVEGYGICLIGYHLPVSLLPYRDLTPPQSTVMLHCFYE